MKQLLIAFILIFSLAACKKTVTGEDDFKVESLKMSSSFSNPWYLDECADVDTTSPGSGSASSRVIYWSYPHDTAIYTPNTVPCIYLDIHAGNTDKEEWTAYNSTPYTQISWTGLDEIVSEGTIDSMVAQVRSMFSEYDVNVTTDKDVFDATVDHNRAWIVVAGSRWYTTWAVSGLGWRESYFYPAEMENIPNAFVFANRLIGYGDDDLMIANSVAHETGHTLGMHHQSVFSSCVNVQEYRYGTIMGQSWWPLIKVYWMNNYEGCPESQKDEDWLELAFP